MVLRALLYAVAVFVLTGIIALAVAGIILLLYRTVRRNEKKKESQELESKTASQDKPVHGREGA